MTNSSHIVVFFTELHRFLELLVAESRINSLEGGKGSHLNLTAVKVLWTLKALTLGSILGHLSPVLPIILLDHFTTPPPNLDIYFIKFLIWNPEYILTLVWLQ